MTSKPKALIQKRFHEVLVELYEDEIDWIDEELKKNRTRTLGGRGGEGVKNRANLGSLK